GSTIPVRRSVKIYVFLGSNTFFSKGSLRLKTVFPWELTIFSIVYGRIFTPQLANMAYPLTISSTDTEAVPKASEATGGTSLEIPNFLGVSTSVSGRTYKLVFTSLRLSEIVDDCANVLVIFL